MANVGIGQLLVQNAVTRIATGFEFTEGPLWNIEHGYLLFSDLPADVRRRWDPANGTVEVRRPNNKGNGMAYDTNGALLVCEHVTSAVVQEVDGERLVVASHFDGKELNSPNDVIVAHNGAVYFSDPSYGRRPVFGVEREQELSFQGVYGIGVNGGITLVSDDFAQPNGLCLSPDESLLYVADTERCEISVFDRSEDGDIDNPRVFASGIGPDPNRPGVPDGLKCDALGNVYCTGPGGIWIFDAEGSRLGVIDVPEVAANLNWGGDRWTDLYITASTSVYLIAMAVSGNRVPGMTF